MLEQQSLPIFRTLALETEDGDSIPAAAARLNHFAVDIGAKRLRFEFVFYRSLSAATSGMKPLSAPVRPAGLDVPFTKGAKAYQFDGDAFDRLVGSNPGFVKAMLDGAWSAADAQLEGAPPPRVAPLDVHIPDDFISAETADTLRALGCTMLSHVAALTNEQLEEVGFESKDIAEIRSLLEAAAIEQPVEDKRKSFFTEAVDAQ